METQTVKQLQEVAKQRGIRRYYSLRKAELIDALTAATPMTKSLFLTGTAPKVLLDSPVPELDVPVLVPTKYIPKPQPQTGIMSTIKSFANWLVSFVPERIKNLVNEKLEALKSKVNSIFNRIKANKYEIKETKSAIRGVTKQYTIDGQGRVDPSTFLNAVRPQVIISICCHNITRQRLT